MLRFITLSELMHCAEGRGVEILGVHEQGRAISLGYCKVGLEAFLVHDLICMVKPVKGGVGLLLSSGVCSNRIVDFDGNQVTTIIIIYLPTNVAPVKEVETYTRTSELWSLMS